MIDQELPRVAPRLDIDDADARERLAVLALRGDDMATLQELAKADPALGRRVARRLIDGGLEWQMGPLSGVERLPSSLCNIIHVSVDDRLWVAATSGQDVRTAFSLDCAEHVLPIFEAVFDDPRPREALAHARQSLHRLILVKDNTLVVAAAECAAAFGHRDLPCLHTPGRYAPRSAARALLAAIPPTQPWDAISHATLAAREAARGVAWGAGLRGRAQGEAEIVGHRRERAWQRARLLAYLLGEVSA